jgi:hypothetical protein
VLAERHRADKRGEDEKKRVEKQLSGPENESVLEAELVKRHISDTAFVAGGRE